jgi:hypothetical protein
MYIHTVCVSAVIGAREREREGGKEMMGGRALKKHHGSARPDGSKQDIGTRDTSP